MVKKGVSEPPFIHTTIFISLVPFLSFNIYIIYNNNGNNNITYIIINNNNI